MKNFCMSSYLTFRFIKDENINFYPDLKHTVYSPMVPQYVCNNAQDLDKAILSTIKKEYVPGKSAVFLSGGIDSAIVASYLPAGTKAYTFKCVAKNSIDETAKAAEYARQYDLDHEIIEIHWKDFEQITPILLKENQVPFHSIEVQLYKAAMIAKNQGIEKIFIGESADLLYGGMDKLLSKDWLLEDFIERYTFINPEKVLANPVSMDNIYEQYRHGDQVDLLRFLAEIFSIESFTSYMHALNLVGINYVDPYAYTMMGENLDLARVRNGEPKYIVRELFKIRYQGFIIPYKIPMPRAMDQWLEDWSGPKRSEFLDGAAQGLTGDQKWMLYCLECFLNIFDKEKI